MEEAQAEERTEQLIEQAYTYLREKTYPDGCSETKKRVIRKKAAKFEVKDGELYYKQKQNGKVILVDLCVHLYLCVCKTYIHVYSQASICIDW